MHSTKIGKCLHCEKEKSTLYIINIPEFGEIKICLSCLNKLRMKDKRFKSEKYSDYVTSVETPESIIIKL